MANVEISPKWVEKLFYKIDTSEGGLPEASEADVNSFKSNIIAIHGVSSIEVFNAYNEFLNSLLFRKVGIESHLCEFETEDFIFVGEDGADFSLVFRVHLTQYSS